MADNHPSEQAAVRFHLLMTLGLLSIMADQGLKLVMAFGFGSFVSRALPDGSEANAAIARHSEAGARIDKATRETVTRGDRI